MSQKLSNQYIGRFAPTPSGPLHLGSLVTGLASYCDARAHQGKWLVRIEDVDTPRNVKGAADDILSTLESFGLEWDEQVYYQSQQFDHYQSILDQLNKQGCLYQCQCSKKNLLKQHPMFGPLGLIYPGNCKNLGLDINKPRWRLKIPDNLSTRFKDLHCGTIEMDLFEQVGDVILKRNDGVFAYHLAVVIDDAMQNVNTIVRGADLLPVTNLHLYLNQLLGFPQSQYLHTPLVCDDRGNKLSKQTGAMAVSSQHPVNTIHQALQFLGQDIGTVDAFDQPKDILEQAINCWNRESIPAVNRNALVDQGLT